MVLSNLSTAKMATSFLREDWNKLANLFSFTHTTPIRVLILGLDDAGKTTILNRLKLGELIQTAPTMSINRETLSFKDWSMDIWDIGGADKVCFVYG